MINPVTGIDHTQSADDDPTDRTLLPTLNFIKHKSLF